jgi:hypothetical protein
MSKSLGFPPDLAHAPEPNRRHYVDGGASQSNGDRAMAKGQARSNKEAKKPKAAAKVKTPASEAAPKAAAKFGKKGTGK